MIRGAVYRVDLGEAKRGHEQRGRRFGLVVSDGPDQWTVVTIVPTSTSAGPSTFRPEIEVDGTATRLLVDQIRTIDVAYIKGGPVSMLDRYEMGRVEHALSRYLGLA